VKIGLYARVLWRFRWLVALGVVVAAALAFLSVARVDPHGFRITYRTSQTWASRSTLLITQQAFPEGRSVFAQTIPPAGVPKETQFVPKFADQGRFSQLADLYAQLATSDPVKQLMRRGRLVPGKVQAFPTQAVNGQSTLPLLTIQGLATSQRNASVVAAAAVTAFTTFIESQQRRSGVPENQRVILKVLEQPVKAQLVRGRPKTLPIVVFFAIMFCVVGLAMLLENLRPRVQGVARVAQLGPQLPPELVRAPDVPVSGGEPWGAEAATRST
jgi:hypothetical protein